MQIEQKIIETWKEKYGCEPYDYEVRGAVMLITETGEAPTEAIILEAVQDSYDLRYGGLDFIEPRNPEPEDFESIDEVSNER